MSGINFEAHIPTRWAWTILGQTQSPSAASLNSIWDFLVKGGPMMIPIGICSLVALAVIFERALTLRRSAVIPPKFLDEIRAKRLLGPTEAIKYCREKTSPIANIVLAGLRRNHHSTAQREKAIQEAGQREVFVMRRRLRLLSVIAALAPVLGLLGTIFGMIKAFQTVATSGEALGKTELLAKGIYEALITTAAGLCLAIPTIIAYHWVTSRIEKSVHEMDRVIEDVFEEPLLEADKDESGGGAVTIPQRDGNQNDDGRGATRGVVANV